MKGGAQLPPPNPPVVPPAGEPGGLYGWAGEEFVAGRFNAIHMCLIPKGPYRGHVLVWNRHAVVLRPGNGFDPNNFWAFQAWSIVNPSVNAPAPRFRNYLLPIGPVTLPPGVTLPDATNPIDVADLFCTGHAWSHRGDLIVAGGATFRYRFNLAPGFPVIQQWDETGARFVLEFNPSAAVAPFPGQPTPFYSGSADFGRWRFSPDQLQLDRYYPTVTVTHGLSRTQQTPTVIVAGGGDPLAAPTNPLTDPLNTYEAFRVSPVGSFPFLPRDSFPSPSSQAIYVGSGTASTSTDADWLRDYPRLHLLSDGKVFLSGPAYKGAKVDHESPPLSLNGWDATSGGQGTNWPNMRDGGSSVFFARYGALRDVVVRLCGDGAPGATNTAEVCLATTGTTANPAPWLTLPPVPPAPRSHTNAVILPDGSIVVIGGNSASGSYLDTAQFRLGVGWQLLAPAPTYRNYHACCVLLPDGRVFVGGGEGRHDSSAPGPHDYDVFEPPYIAAPSRPCNVVLPQAAIEADGTYLLNNDQSGIELQCDIGALGSIERVVLMAPGAMTHHSDMSARYIEMELDPTPGQGITVPVGTASMWFKTPEEKVLPRGYYMLFVVEKTGVPSEATWVRIT
ncbi:MAG: galactose oxidase early set domain-containing protein [Planctomycetes bacterium]|nr:galactose oxidase early set domain-containing protein [Planctomycetota bacterium]